MVATMLVLPITLFCSTMFRYPSAVKVLPMILRQPWALSQVTTFRLGVRAPTPSKRMLPCRIWRPGGRAMGRAPWVAATDTSRRTPVG